MYEQLCTNSAFLHPNRRTNGDTWYFIRSTPFDDTVRDLFFYGLGLISHRRKRLYYGFPPNSTVRCRAVRSGALLIFIFDHPMVRCDTDFCF